MDIPVQLLVLGFTGKAMGWFVTAYQLHKTRQAKRPVVPTAGLIVGMGSLIALFSYYVAIGEPVGIIGYGVGFFSRSWNLYYALRYGGNA